MYQNLKTRMPAVVDCMYRTVMPHSEVAIHMGLAGSIVNFRLLSCGDVELFQEGRYLGRVVPCEAGILEEGGVMYFHPAPTMPIRQKVWAVRWVDDCTHINVCENIGLARQFAAGKVLEAIRRQRPDSELVVEMIAAYQRGAWGEVLQLFDDTTLEPVILGITETEVLTQYHDLGTP